LKVFITGNLRNSQKSSSATDISHLVTMGAELTKLTQHLPGNSSLSKKVKEAQASIFDERIPLDLAGVENELELVMRFARE